MVDITKTAWIPKKEAWSPLEYEKSIPIDYSVHQFRFTRKWFRNRNQVTYSTFLPSKFIRGDYPVNAIQIGVFEGMDLVWQLQNILTHKDSRVLAIDPWMETGKLSQKEMDECYGRAQKNLLPWRKKVELVRGMSGDVLTRIVSAGEGTVIKGKKIPPGDWDLVVIDGDHRSMAVYQDARLSLELLRVGGWLLFDDVRQNRTKKDEVPEGLEKFLQEYGDQVSFQFAHRFMNCYEKIK